MEKMLFHETLSCGRDNQRPYNTPDKMLSKETIYTISTFTLVCTDTYLIAFEGKSAVLMYFIAY